MSVTINVSTQPFFAAESVTGTATLSPEKYP